MSYKILYWAEKFWPDIGGIEIFSCHLMEALARRGYEFAVVTSVSNYAEHTEYCGIPVHRFPFHTALTNRDVVLIKEILSGIGALKKEFGPHLIHLNTCGPSLFFHERALSRQPSPVLFTVHGLWEKDIDRLAKTGMESLLCRVLEKASLITAVSEATRKNLLKLVPKIAPYCSVVHNSLKKSDLRPEKLPFSPPRILCIGRLSNGKAFDLMIRALAALKNTNPDTRLQIVGDGDERENLESLAAELGVNEQVEFSGWVAPPDIPRLLNTATLLVAPSRGVESFGLVALEAAQMERPVVVSDAGGLPEVVQHGVSGFVFPSENVERLVEAVRKLLSDERLAVSMGRAGAKRADELFSWDSFVQHFDTLYQNLICGKSRKTKNE